MTAAVCLILYLASAGGDSTDVQLSFGFSDFGDESVDRAGLNMATLAADLVNAEHDLMRSSIISVPLIDSETHEDLHLANYVRRFLRLGRRMFRQRQATIFALADRPDVLLKYEINCDSLHDIHPLVREALMLNRFKDLDITPRFLYLSGPLKFVLPRKTKTHVSLSDADLEKCAHHKRSSVRVIAMENAGPSVYDYVGKGALSENGFPLDDALRITLDLLKILEELHGRGIVHGDVHPGNVVINSNTGKVKIIDFGRAFFAVDFLDKPPNVRAPFSLIHCLLSHWNIEGERFGFRDDLFKALHVLAVLLMGRSFTKHCIALQDDSNPVRLFLFKIAGNYFQIPGLRDPVEEAQDLNSDIRELVKIHLNRAMDIARDQPDVNAPARIAEVRVQLQAALDLASPRN